MYKIVLYHIASLGKRGEHEYERFAYHVLKGIEVLKTHTGDV